jgi:hypothetical protein
MFLVPDELVRHSQNSEAFNNGESHTLLSPGHHSLRLHRDA